MTTETIPHDVKDPRLAEEGVRRIEWAAREMPVLDSGKYIVVWKREGDAWRWHRDIWNSSRPVS